MKKTMLRVVSLMMVFAIIFVFNVSVFAASLVCNYSNVDCGPTFFTGRFYISSGVCSDSHSFYISSLASSTRMEVDLYNSNGYTMGTKVLTGTKGSWKSSNLSWTNLPSGYYYIGIYCPGDSNARATGYVYNGY